MGRSNRKAGKSTGGQYPREELARRIARKSVPDERTWRITAVRYAGNGSCPFDVKREGYGDDISSFPCTNFHASVRGFLVALRGEDNHDFVEMPDLLALCNADIEGLDLDTAESQQRVPMDKLTAFTRAGLDGVWLAATARHSNEDIEINALTVSFTTEDGEEQSFENLNDLASRGERATHSEWEDAIHAARALYAKYKELVESLMSLPGYGEAPVRVCSIWPLGSRSPASGPIPSELSLNPAFLVPYTHKKTGLGCAILAAANAISIDFIVMADDFVIVMKERLDAGNMNRMKSINNIFQEVQKRKFVPGWKNFRLEDVLDKNIRDLQDHHEERLNWVLEYRGLDPLLMTLVDSDGSNQHVVALVLDQHKRFLVLDSEEDRALPLEKESLSRCCGSAGPVTGIGEVMKLVERSKKSRTD